MIPVKLTVKGLYSYQSTQEIDFQPLTGASVFGIFGKVGSGKSSLLEAISFALYGESERLNNRDNRVYNMMNLKSGHLLIDFEFRAGAHQQLYKFIYEARRHPKKHHEIALTERRSFQWEVDKWVPLGIEKDDIATLTKSILGLDYDNFKRTIIIPQNQFREFLELKSADRTEMMSQMFRLEKYDLTKQTAKLKEANEAALNVVKGQLEGVNVASPEAIDAARQAVETILIAIREKELDATVLTVREKQLSDLQQRHQERTNAGAELEKLKADQHTYQQIRERIEQYEACRLVFSVLFSQADRVAKQQAEIAKKLLESSRELTNVEQRLPALRQAYQTALTAFENRDELQKKIDELYTVTLIRSNQRSIQQQTKNRDALRKDSASQTIDIDQLKTKRTQHQTLLTQAEGRESPLERLYVVRDWFTEYRPLKKEVDELDRRLQAHDASLEAIKQRKVQMLADLPEWHDLPLKQLPTAIQEAIDALQKVAGEQKTSYDDHALRQKLHQYANALVEGKPCPLCGSAHHPAISHDETIVDDVAKSKTVLAETEQQIRKMNTLLGKAEGLLGEIKTVHSQGKTLINDRTETVARRTGHEGKFIWSEFTMEQSEPVDEAIRQENEALQKRQKAQKAVSDMNGQLENLERQKAGIDADAAKLDGILESLTKSVTQQLNKLVYFRPADIDTLTPLRINDLTDDLTRQYDLARDTFTRAEQAKSTAEAERIRYETEVGNYQKQQTDGQTEGAGLDTAIAKLLISHGYTRPQVDAILATNLDVVVERERIRAFEQQLNTVQSHFDALTTELADQLFDDDNLQRTRAELDRVQGESKTLNQQLGENRKVHSELVAQWDRKRAIQEQFEVLTLRQKDLADMAGLFRAQGFVNYVSSVYLQNLCEAANERFARLTNNHLKLEIDEKNNFLVRDHLNGGQTRLAKTLSGGQLFQASLSLALALSDNIQHLTKSKQNLFFLDEGFGSLDKDSLQTVFKTLQALRSENRIVGIISHVEELQHEIETFIHTEHTDTGSRITRSWEQG